MLLAADVGNTNVVFALFSYDEDGKHTIRARWRIATDPRRTGDEYAVWLLQLLTIEGVAREQITQIIVASVVPRADHNLTVLCEKYFGITDATMICVICSRVTPSMVSNCSSHTAYSSPVRRGSVAIRQRARIVCVPSSS